MESINLYVCGLLLLVAFPPFAYTNGIGLDNAVDSLVNQFTSDLTERLNNGKSLNDVMNSNGGNGAQDVNVSLTFFRIERKFTRYLTRLVEEELRGSFRSVQELVEDIHALHADVHVADDVKTAAEKYLRLLSFIPSALNITSKFDTISSFEKFSSALIAKMTSPQAVSDLKEFFESQSEAFKSTEFGKDIMAVLNKASNEQLGKFLRHLLVSSSTGIERRGIFDIFSKIKAWFQAVGKSISSKFSDFSSWASQHWTSVLATIKSKTSVAQALAKEFISHAAQASKKVAGEALEYFKTHKLEIAKAVFKHAITIAGSILLASG